MKVLAVYPSLELRAGARPGTCVLTGRAGVDPRLVADGLARIARTHAALSHACIPRVEACDRTALVFACDAETDLETCVARAEQRGERVPYAMGIALPALLADTIAHVHERRETFVGGVSLRSIRVRADGRVQLFGLGHNFVVRHIDDTPAFDPGVFGGEREPSQTSDVLALYEMTRSLLPIVDLPPALARVFRANRADEQSALGDLLAWAMRNLIGRAPRDRSVTVREAMNVYRIAWRLLGVTPDIEGLSGLLRRIAAHRDEADEERMRLEGHRVVWSSGRSLDLSTRGAARRILSALIEATRAGCGLSTDELFAAGWPGQQLDPATRSRRVRVEVSRLRGLGLQDDITHDKEGFRVRLRG